MMECESCGTLQRLPPAHEKTAVQCVTCDSELERTTGRSTVAALGIAITAFLVFIPANTLPFLQTSVLNQTRTSYIVSGAGGMFIDGWPVLGVFIFFVTILAPFLRFGFVVAVLTTIRTRYRPEWLGPMFRWANWLETWCMTDVLLLGLWVSYARLAATVSIELQTGGKCFIAVGLCTLFLTATLDKRTVWNKILRDERDSDDIGMHPVACMACERVAPSSRIGTPCPRCRLRLRARKPQSVSRASALTLASVLLYIPANLYPMATLPIGIHQVTYTVLGGVIDLVESHLLGLAALVFCASFLIPFLKLAGLGWCIVSVLRGSTKALKAKTHLYHLVDVVGRWSMVDPLVLACFVPVTQFNAAIASRAEPAALAFTGVVYLTVVAARSFDPRLMWDPARAHA